MATDKKRSVTLRQVAQELGLSEDLVRDVLREAPGISVPKADQDRIFKTARRMGYDFRKLKIGKRMQYRKETFEEVLERIQAHPRWGREEIVAYLRECLDLVDRVHRRVFREEFGAERS
ncbi:MAG TPA: hypothetical protein VNO22_18070 [Planctomycetota bacterium]|nr:hypothetical protein [Planctomycetota bacterium]